MPSRHDFTRRSSPKDRGGFVLVAVLLLIALATVLIVTTSSVSQIERKAVANSAKEDQARQNALFALQVALAQLQKEAGPDQRITATADIMSGGGAVANPYWTGVWKTGTNGLDVVNSGTPQRQTSLGALTPTAAQIAGKASWLVSGASDGTTVNPLTWSDTTSIALATNYGTNTTASYQTVRVPLVQITNSFTIGGTTRTNVGAYAYWVSDEGVKAKVNQNDPTLGSTDPSRNQLHFLAPQATAAHKGSAEFGTTDLRSNTNDVPKITTLQSLANITGLSGLAGTNAARIAPDFTTYSYGVLADVRRGGLRKDLTAAMENTSAFNSLTNTYGYGAGMVYRSATSAGLTIPFVDTGVTPSTDGLLWHSLYFYYNTYKATMPAPVATSGTTTSPTSSGNPATLPQVQSPRIYTLNLAGNATKLSGLVPVPIAYRIDIAISSYLSNNWKLRLHYFPQLVLWNPYAVRLSFNNYQFQRNVGAFATVGTPTTITVKTVSGGTTKTNADSILLNQTPSGRFPLVTKAGDCNILEPGETRVFALDNDASTTSIANAGTFNALVCNPNMTADYSQYADLCDTQTSDGTATIQVSLSQRTLRCQNVDTFILPTRLKWPYNDGSVRYLSGGNWDIAAAGTTWNSSLSLSDLRWSSVAPTGLRRVIGFYIRQKGLNFSSGTNSYSSASSSIPLFMGNSTMVSPLVDQLSNVWQEVYLSPLGTNYQNGQTDVQLAPNGTYWETSFGDQSAGAGTPGVRRVIADVPNQPMVSLGQFMHMPAAYFWSSGSFQYFTMGSMFVGGSVASPTISTDMTALKKQVGATTTGIPQYALFLDNSFLANEALFDRFFLSTVPPSGSAPSGTTWPAIWTTFNAANSGSTLTDPSKPLLNSRIKLYYSGGTNPPVMADLRDMEKAAANLVLDGAFNINSTSVAAWKAFLGGLSGNDLSLYNAGTRAPATESTSVGGVKGVAFSRFWSASGQTTPNTVWSGLRVLSDAQLDDLATKIVAEVKLRGPFLSLADFLNRRLGLNTSPLSRCGALQAAIDKTSPDINGTIKASGVAVNATTPITLLTAPPFITQNMVDANGNMWNTALGVPGYLMQQDIVQAIASAIAARSDTFLIRTYGEVRNPRTGAVESRAYGEAVVQRTPELVDSSQLPQTAQSSLNTTNQQFGRRFKVVSFRWLNSNEI